jgi:MFS family permease
MRRFHMVFVAGPWFVLETTGSAARTGIVTGALALGTVIPAVLGGPLVDRLGFKRSSVLADLASAWAVAAVPLLHLAGNGGVSALVVAHETPG